MTTLVDRQRAFGDALRLGADAALLDEFAACAAPAALAAFGSSAASGASGSSAAAGPTARLARRFAAYRRNVLGNWRAALRANYPVLAAQLGEAHFFALGERYLAAHVSRDADLNRYGDRLAETLADDPAARDWPWLPDLARLEWALLEDYGAAPARPPLARLLAVPPARQGEAVLRLAAGHFRLPTEWPLVDLWHAHQRADEARDAALGRLDLAARPRVVVIGRDPAGSGVPREISLGEGVFADACAAGRPLADALGEALAAEPGLDAAALLPRWLAEGWIADVAAPD